MWYCSALEGSLNSFLSIKMGLGVWISICLVVSSEICIGMWSDIIEGRIVRSWNRWAAWFDIIARSMTPAPLCEYDVKDPSGSLAERPFSMVVLLLLGAC